MIFREIFSGNVMQYGHHATAPATAICYAIVQIFDSDWHA